MKKKTAKKKELARVATATEALLACQYENADLQFQVESLKDSLEQAQKRLALSEANENTLIRRVGQEQERSFLAEERVKQYSKLVNDMSQRNTLLIKRNLWDRIINKFSF